LPATHIRRQVEHLVRSGSREVVLCGVDLGAWGADLPGTSMDLAVLVASLCELPGDYRLRLSSLDPAHLSDALISQFASQPRLCPHLHLSLQSGNTLILKRMKRRYTAEQALERVARIRAAVPGLVLGADIMVGFPTEDDAAFADTEALMAAMYIAYPHVFAYSDRPGTPAARIPRQVPHRVRRFRAARLRRQAVGLRERLVATRIGCAARVLVEDTGGAPAGYRRARSADYLEAWVPEEFAAGRWLDVIYTGRCGEGLIARPKP
jgi:threonylcarbamoyladenosine tRNA methylthiotransferase MtaB